MREPAKENLKFFLIYLLLTCLYFNKIFVEGIVILNSDSLLQNYPLRDFYAQALKSFTFPLWNPYEFAGLPFLGQMQTGALYPPNAVLYFFLPAPYAFNASFLLHYALAGFFTFLYLRAIGLGKLPAFAGGAVFALSGFLVGHKPHTAIINASVWLPLILYFLEKLRRTVEVRYAALLALAVGVQLLAGNFQMCFYTDIVLLLFFVYYAFVTESDKRRRFLAYGAAAVVLGFSVAAPQILPVMELSELSYRGSLARMLGHEFPSLWHVYFSSLPALVFPFLFGGGSYGVAGFAGITDMMAPFVGAAAAVVALTALFIERRNTHVRFWGVVAFVGLVLSLGSSTPLFSILERLPVFKDLRSHGRNLLEFNLAVSVLLAVGLEGIFHGNDKTRRYLRAAAMVFGAVLAASVLAIAIMGSADTASMTRYLSSLGFKNPTGFLDNITLRNPAVYVPLALVSAYLLWCLIYMRKGSTAMRYVVVAIMIAEGFSFGAFHEVSGPPIRNLGRSYDMHAAFDFVAAGGPNRVMKVSASWVGASLYNVPRRVGSINSYDQLSLESYTRLLELNTVGVMPRDELQLELLIRNNAILSALNTRYLIVPRGVWLPGMDAASGGPPAEAHAVSMNWRATGNVTVSDGAFIFPAKGGQEVPKLISNVPLTRGKHYVSFKARRRGAEKSVLEFQVHYPPQYTQSYRMGVVTDSVAKAEKTVFEAPVDGVYIISFTSDSTIPVELTDPRLVRFAPHAPKPEDAGQGVPQKELYRPLYDAGGYTIWENLNSLPRAYMVEEAVPVADFAELNERFYTLQVNPAREALVYASDAEKLEGLSFSRGTASIKNYDLNKVDIDVQSTGQGFLVLADQFYPGWKAYVDGEETTIHETNGVMRGVVVPAGEHKVTFRYMPLKIIFLLGLSLIVTLTLLYISFFRRP